MTDRKATSIRLSAEADRLLDELNGQLGFKSRSAVLELAIRTLAGQAEREPIVYRIGAEVHGQYQIVGTTTDREEAVRLWQTLGRTVPWLVSIYAERSTEGRTDAHED